jgi:Family of unknown function (DUF6082)
MSRVLWSLGSIAFLAVVLASPFLLGLYLLVGDVDWSAIADVGQAFSVASALLSAAALVGVVATLRYQALQTRVVQMQVVRSMHFELSKMVMDDPDKYGKFWGYSSGDAHRIVRDGYLNQVLNYAKAGLDLGIHSAESVRSIASDLFASAPGRSYWALSRAAWLDGSRDSSAKRFFLIVDEAYSASVQR